MKISSVQDHPRVSTLATALVVGMATFGVNVSSCWAQENTPAPQVSAPPVEAKLSFSPGIRDVVKMLDAKVDPEVIKAYIKSSPIAFNPSASDIIALKQKNVPDDLITALMQRGAEVRAQLAQAAQQIPPAVAPATPPAGYGYDYSTISPYGQYAYPDYSNYAYGYPYYSYPYYGYPYNYSWWNTYYPWSFYSPFYFGFGGHRFGGFDHRFDHFRGGSFAFHGRPGFGGHAGPWAPARGSFGFRGGFGGGRSFALGGARSGGFVGRSGGFAGGHGGGSHGGGGHR